MKKKRPSGGSVLMTSGKKPLLLGLTPEQHAMIQAAAAKLDLPMTQFVIRQALEAAQKIILQST
jgi:uncharacterized protein (DUF1778 family)